MELGRRDSEQIAKAAELIRDVLRVGLLGLYLHGSATTVGLRPQSDLDLLAVTAIDPTPPQAQRLLAGMLKLSGRHPPSDDGPRCLELMVFNRADLGRVTEITRTALVYGEWLRDDLEAGRLLQGSDDPEHTLVLAQARHDAIRLYGAPPSDLFPNVPMRVARQAMLLMLPSLLETLADDRNNVLMTLARMWRTAHSGDFLSKDAAAEWTMPRLAPAQSSLMGVARQAYIGQGADDLDGHLREADHLARYLADQINALLAS